MRRPRRRSNRWSCRRFVRATSSWSRALSARACVRSSKRSPAPTRMPRLSRHSPKVDPMLYWLVELSDKVSVFNVFRYITFRTGGAVVTALVFVFLFGPAIINMLRVKQGKGQPIRSDGPQSHLLTKIGTPTMGGLMILSGLVVATVLWANPANRYVWIVLGVTLGFGLVGFYDDYLKVTKQSHDGFSGKTRLVIESIIAAVACFALAGLGRAPFATSLTFPFFKEAVLDLGWFFIMFGAFIIVGAGNA